MARLDGNLSASPLSQTDMWVYPRRHYFGSVEVGDTSPSQTIMLFITVGWNVAIDSPSITGTDASQFVIWADECSGQVLSESDICEVSVLFSPTSAGAKSAYLIVPSGEPDTPALSIPLTGVGTLYGDIDGDGKLSILDVIHMLRKVVGLE